MKRFFNILMLVAVMACTATETKAISFDLDSIAAWGKFPRFCVNTYRWGSTFFNGFDTTYVAGTGYKWNVKLTTDSWLDGYRFITPNNTQVLMFSDPSTSLGVYLQYMAVSAGYDVNLSKLFTGKEQRRKRLRFGFNCMLFSVEAYMISNDVGTTIKRFGPKSDMQHYDIPFNGINNSTWGIDAYYFFNHKRYSEAASFNFSRVQKKSQGSFFAGVSIYTQKLDFDFSELPPYLRNQLPDTWANYHYRVNTHNYALRLGYGFNWVFHPQWVFGVSESPIVGVRKGYVNSDIEKVSFCMYNRMMLSLVWNSKNSRLFAGVVGKADVALVNDQQTTFAGGIVSGEAVVGYRFNLW